jgi:dCTP deaminase
MVVNRQSLLTMAPIKDMLKVKVYDHGVSHGLSEAGYDIQIKQDVKFSRHHMGGPMRTSVDKERPVARRFAIASAIERFQMPHNLMGIVHDKSSWARQGLSVFNTVIEPGWEGYLTLELVYHGEEPLVIPAGSGIAQVVFHEVTDLAAYTGRYQDQEDEPVPAIRA